MAASAASRPLTRVNILLPMIAFLLASTSTDVEAQLRFIGTRQPECRAFIIYEAGLLGAASGGGSDQYERGSVYFQHEIGLMVNVGKRHSIGIANVLLHHRKQFGDWRDGVVVKGRRWLDRRNSLGMEAGAYLLGNHSAPGLACLRFQVDFSYANWVAVAAGLESFPTGTKTHVDPVMGLKVGPYPTAGLTLAFVAATVLVVANGGFGD